ncbi:LamB/YcsF family protein [Streptococcus caprae]|uniref:5-oxoprolinase subunit A n=1 Tax=Streptococcus caprae TaxID=1640501 RepID=A0ABV8CUB3_9STRE
MAYLVDLNSDLGESFGAYRIGQDQDIIPLITSANVACGYHAGDPLVMEKTCQMVKESGIAMGAHPGFPDLIGFGRRNLQVSPSEAAAYITYQLGALEAFTRHHGITLQHVKPHGALYNMAAKDKALATAIAQAVARYDDKLILLCPGASEMALAGQAAGLKIAKEVFADRAYENDGSLVTRSKEGAMITDENLAIDRLIQMITKGTVQSIDGKDIPIQADSICVHGDGAKALAFVQNIRTSFSQQGIELAPLSKIIS